MSVAFVQKAAATFGDSVTTLTASLTGTTSGNLCVLETSVYNGDAISPSSATPTASGWTMAVRNTGPTGSDNFKPAVAIFYQVSTGGTVSATLNYADGCYCEATISEYAGTGAGPWTLDVTAHNELSAGTDTSGASGTTAATASSSNVVVAVVSVNDPSFTNVNTLSDPPSSGYTSITSNNSNATHICCDSGYQLNVSGTQSASWTWTNGARLAAAIAVFNFTASTAAPPQPPLFYSRMQPRTAGGGVLIKTPLAYILPASSNSLSFALQGVTGTGSAGSVSAFVSSTVPPPLPPRLGSSTGLGGLMPQVFLQNPPPQFANVTVTLTGVTGTGSAGTVSAFVSSTVPPLLPPSLGPATGLGGVLPTIKLAYPVPASILSANVTVSLTGVTGTGSVGTLTAFVSSTVPPMLPPQLGPATGQGGILPTLKLAYVQPEFTNLYLTLAGVTGTGSVGTITVAVDMPLPSVTGTGSAGTITAAIATSALASTTGTGSAGLVAATVSSALAGVSASSSVGTISPAIATFLLAVTGTGSAGTITSSGGTPVNNPYHSVAFFSSVAGYNSVSFFQSVAQFNSEAQP